MRRFTLCLGLLAFISCNSEQYQYVEPAPNLTIETLLEDGTPVSVEVTYEKIECDYDFSAPDYVTTDPEGTAGIYITDGYWQFYCRSGNAKEYTCVNLRKGDRRVKLILEE